MRKKSGVMGESSFYRKKAYHVSTSVSSTKQRKTRNLSMCNAISIFSDSIIVMLGIEPGNSNSRLKKILSLNSENAHKNKTKECDAKKGSLNY